MRTMITTSERDAHPHQPEFPFVSLATATHVKVVVPHEATGELLMPTLVPSGLLKRHGMDLAMRECTVRRFDDVARLLTPDFVLHSLDLPKHQGLSTHWIEGSGSDDLHHVGFTKAAVNATGYWRLGRAGGDHNGDPGVHP